MIKYYYARITDSNLYMDDINLLEYLSKYFPAVYTYYQDMIKKSEIVNFNRYKEFRISFNRKVMEEGLSPYLLLKKENGEVREINTNSLLVLSNLKKPKLKRLTIEEVETLYTDDYRIRTNKYVYFPSVLDDNPIFDLDCVEEEQFKIIKKTN